jgi:hypothetical protein
MNKSNYLRKKVNDHILSGIPYTAPADGFIHLYTVAPTAAGGGTEVSGSGYAATAIDFDATNFPAATSVGVTTLNQVIDCGGASGGAWGTVVAVGIKDDSTNLMYFANLTTPRAVADGEAFSFRIGDLVFTES